MRESRTLGSVRAKAEWLSYSTTLVGGYQVLNKWLKDREGRELSHGDIRHYLKVSSALSHTMRLMTEIDEAIGPWPIQ